MTKVSFCNSIFEDKDHDLHCVREKGHTGFHKSSMDMIWFDEHSEPENIFDYIHWLEKKINAGGELLQQLEWSVENLTDSKEERGVEEHLVEVVKEAEHLKICMSEYRIATCEHVYADPTNQAVDANGHEVCINCGLIKDTNRYAP